MPGLGSQGLELSRGALRSGQAGGVEWRRSALPESQPKAFFLHTAVVQSCPAPLLTSRTRKWGTQACLEEKDQRDTASRGLWKQSTSHLGAAWGIKLSREKEMTLFVARVCLPNAAETGVVWLVLRCAGAGALAKGLRGQRFPSPASSEWARERRAQGKTPKSAVGCVAVVWAANRNGRCDGGRGCEWPVQRGENQRRISRRFGRI